MRLRALNLCLRYGVKPFLRRARSPARQAWLFDRFGPYLFPGLPFVCHLTETQGHLTLHWVSHSSVYPRRVILYFHGGAYFVGSGTAYRGMLGRLSQGMGLRVCAPDYRLLQQAAFPAAFDDAVQAWEALCAKGYRRQDIVLGGDSAGGGLMLALLAHLCQRRTPPAACFAMSPWTDLTLSGASLQSPSEVLLPVSRIPEVVARYLDGAAADDPRASPLFADFPAPPPVLIQVGSGEALLDDSRRMAKKLGREADLRIWPNVPHVWPFFADYLPESRAALAEVAEFVQTSFAMDSR